MFVSKQCLQVTCMEVLMNFFWLHTCGIDGAFFTSLQRPLDQSKSIIHVVSRTHSFTSYPSRLLQQPQDVWRLRCIPPHTFKAPVLFWDVRFMSTYGLQSASDVLQPASLAQFKLSCCPTCALVQQICGLTLFWSTYKLNPLWPWLQPQLSQGHSCSAVVLKAKSIFQSIFSLLSQTQTPHSGLLLLSVYLKGPVSGFGFHNLRMSLFFWQRVQVLIHRVRHVSTVAQNGQIKHWI